ncbi:DJ-1/PfpI family protein [Breoghania sp.]|uniref:DJ-1/PfpI family protein n=1 Tax=Breoghania sp. TaxID=2065378 RepID=UPI00262D6FFE|nr:DJ-1/PfpI family protein [Breoghania sp.]MDJ0932679.1 DJ-1/PfpI family protein [Breoghania sp.]
MLRSASRKILMIVEDFSEDYEVMVSFQALGMVGFTVDAVCPGQRTGDFIKTAIHNFEGDQTYTEKPGHLFRLNATFAFMEAEHYAGFYLTGGRACEYLRLVPEILTFVHSFMTADRPVAAICHAAQILAAADVLKGRRLTAYPAVAPEIRAVGGDYVAIEPEETDIDGNLVTSPAWPGHPGLLRAFAQLVDPQILT